MGLRIKTNVESLKATRQLSNSNRMLQDSMERLASGQRINRSADDAAGLAVSERIRGRIRSLDVAKRNANDGISYIQVAEGGLNEVTNMVVRMRELTSQAASDTIGDLERSFLDKEFQQMRKEVRRIIDSTEFNGAKVLSAQEGEDVKPIQIFVGASNRGTPLSGEEVELEDGAVDPDILEIDLNDLTKLTTELNNLFSISPDEGEGRSEISLVPFGDEGGAQNLGKEDGGTNGLFTDLDNTLNAIAGYRATLGSVQSRLNSTITNIEISNENLSAARSRIVDVDYASESARFAQGRILAQAGLSVQAQANSYPEMALSLIR